MTGPRSASSAFASWLRGLIAAHGGVKALGAAAKVDRNGLSALAAGERQPTRDLVRRLADFAGADPAIIEAIAGYPAYTGPSITDLDAFPTIGAWVTAAVASSGDSPAAVAKQIGIAASALARITRDEVIPNPTTLRQLANRFGVAEAALLARRPAKHPGFVAAGLRAWERHGEQHTRRMRELAPTLYRKGKERACVFCGEQIYRKPSAVYHPKKGSAQVAPDEPRVYHVDCHKEWRRTGEMRELARAFGTLGQIRQRVKASGDAKLLEEVDAKIAAELHRLRNPNDGGRPPTLLENRDLAREMARLQHEGGLTAGEVAELAGLPVSGPPAKREAGAKAYRLLRLGRALLGYDRLDAGPRREAS